VGGRQAQRMQRYWIEATDAVTQLHNIPLGITQSAGPSGTVDFKNAVSIPFEQDLTLARSFLPYAYRIPVTPTAVNVAVGMAVVSPGSIISTLNAVTDAGWDGWMLHQWLVVDGILISSDPKAIHDPLAEEVLSGTFDVKSKRKIPQGSQVLVSFAVEDVAGGGTQAQSFDFAGRFLMMEK